MAFKFSNLKIISDCLKHPNASIMFFKKYSYVLV